MIEYDVQQQCKNPQKLLWIISHECYCLIFSLWSTKIYHIHWITLCKPVVDKTSNCLFVLKKKNYPTIQTMANLWMSLLWSNRKKFMKSWQPVKNDYLIIVRLTLPDDLLSTETQRGALKWNSKTVWGCFLHCVLHMVPQLYFSF